jgi:hypothetical protein
LDPTTPAVRTPLHVRELLQQRATVAFQSMREMRMKSCAANADRRPPLIDSCIAWAASGERVRVRVRFPKFRTGAARGAGDAR